MTFSVKRLILGIFFCSTLTMTGLFGACSEFGLSFFEQSFAYNEENQEKVIEAEDLSPEEKTVYGELGPVYKKIYLYALTSEMRRRVVIYVCRGLNAYEAINVILRAEQRRGESGTRKKVISPGERAATYQKGPVRKIL